MKSSFLLSSGQTHGFVQESARALPIQSDWDVIVCGAGPAGWAAAISAARHGARTALIESQGCLGGVWTSGLLSWIIDGKHKPGLMQELTRELEARGARGTGSANFSYDPEKMKCLVEEWAMESGVAIRLHTRVVGAEVDAEGRLRAIVAESRSGREAFSARVFIDATGDGDLGALAGCGFDYGHPETGEAQPLSLIALVTGLERAEVNSFLNLSGPSAKQRLLCEMEQGGVTPSYGAPTLLCIEEGLYALMSVHYYGVAPFEADRLTEATILSRQEIQRQVEALRRVGGPWRNLKVVATGSQIGVREGRRLHGLYQVTLEDMMQGVRHEDVVCRCRFTIDVHSTNPGKSTAFGPENSIRVYPYDIPLRALIAKDVRGLMMAGRCISGDFLAHSSYRVTGNSVPMGEAAGRVAAEAALTDALPETVDWKPLLAPLRDLSEGGEG